MQSSGQERGEQEALAQQAMGEDASFVRALTALADKREVLAHEDIFAHGGMKLVSRGTRLSGTFYDRLIAHKLLKPIEYSLGVADALDVVTIISLAHDKARLIPSLLPRLEQPDLLGQLEELLGGLSIPAPLALKLTVMQVEMPALFEHSLISAVIATVLGIRGKLAREEIQALALASIFHDIGELYIDPDFLAPGHCMSEGERRFLYVHPLTGYLMLREFATLPPGTAEAVLQHHERLDGTGYPYHLKDGQISTLARCLAVAEVAASLVARHGADRRIGMRFKMNIKKYDASAVSLISQLFDSAPLRPEKVIDEAFLMLRLTQIGKLFEDWVALSRSLSSAESAAMSLLVERMDSLRGLVLEPGYDQCRLEDMLSLPGEGDSEIGLELSVLLDELNWQFHALSRGVERDQSVWGMQIPVRHRQRLDDWLAQVRFFIEEKPLVA
jgi:HD-GYP domain-containing protein (c-di-GMP phosphodiesterase class II)